MKLTIGVLFTLVIVSSAVQLDPSSFQTEVLASGKSAFVKFFAPWCGHCKKMAPAWDELSLNNAESKWLVIADVDCTVHKDLCSEYGVRSYPTVKYFNSESNPIGDAYTGGRDLEVLQQFVDEKLGPSCGPDMKEMCDEEQLLLMEQYLALSIEELEAAIQEKSNAITTAENDFKLAVEAIEKEKEAIIKEISPQLHILRAVGAANPVKTAPELDATSLKKVIESGKSVFVKFQSPWCGHCKKMKPAWDQLSEEYENSKWVAIADVDCTAHKDLCTEYGVKGFPTVKYFTESSRQNGDTYTGGRELEALRSFVVEKLEPSCGPQTNEFCDVDELLLLQKYEALSSEQYREHLKEMSGAITEANTDFRQAYQQFKKEKDAVVEEDTPKLRMMRTVLANKNKNTREEL